MNIQLLQEIYGAASANANKFPDLCIRSAAIFPKQLMDLVSKSSLKELTIINISIFGLDDSYQKLKEVFNRCGSDKSSHHNYHLIYGYIFDQLGIESQLNVLEIGIGTNNPGFPSTMGIEGIPGASLRSFKAYLPNARIYGADLDKTILFTEESIKTAYVDQLDIASFDHLKTKFGDQKYDVVIDDGLHALNANLNTILYFLDKINIGGWIIIEDIDRTKVTYWNVIDSILNTNLSYETFMIDTNTWSWIYIIRRLK